MNFSYILILTILIIPMFLVFKNRLRIDLAALLIAALLGLCQYAGLGILGPANTPQNAAKAISGFGQPVVIVLICLSMITSSLEKSGVTHWITKKVLVLGGSSEKKLIFLLATTTAFLSLFMNTVAAGALLIPTALEAAKKTGIKPSKLLIPVSYGSLLGGMASYFTTANIITSNLLVIAEPPQPALNLLSFAPVGGLMAVTGLAFLGLFGSDLLPDRNPVSDQIPLILTGDELQDSYDIVERTWELLVSAESRLIGQSLKEIGFGDRFGLSVVAIIRESGNIFSPLSNHIILKDDILIVIGKEEQVAQLPESHVIIRRNHSGSQFSVRGVTVAELLISPHSSTIGKSLVQLGFRRRYKLTAIALHRSGTNFRTNISSIKLTAGDALLISGDDEQIQELRENPNFILILSGLSEQPLIKKNAFITIGILLAAITASLWGIPIYLAMLLGAILLLLTGIMTMQEAYNAIGWQAVFLIGGMHAVSLSIIQTGLADQVGNWFVQIVTPFGPLGLAGAAFILSSALSQVIGGQVTAMVTGPIAISAALRMGINAQAIAVAAAVGCSASFLTPFSHAINVLIITPGNYAFSDFLRIGWKLTLLCFITLLAGMALFWEL
ncbi:MAG: SLC13 family permease [Anaerolineaceae bacterium]|nr:SLC13 family permease [Anaerolineaceae bacterium]